MRVQGAVRVRLGRLRSAGLHRLSVSATDAAGNRSVAHAAALPRALTMLCRAASGWRSLGATTAVSGDP